MGLPCHGYWIFISCFHFLSRFLLLLPSLSLLLFLTLFFHFTSIDIEFHYHYHRFTDRLFSISFHDYSNRLCFFLSFSFWRHILPAFPTLTFTAWLNTTSGQPFIYCHCKTPSFPFFSIFALSPHFSTDFPFFFISYFHLAIELLHLISHFSSLINRAFFIFTLLTFSRRFDRPGQAGLAFLSNISFSARHFSDFFHFHIDISAFL